jgi:FkbM family methyltransferase
VVAIEASPSAFAGLQHNIELNHASNIRPVNVAVWSAFADLGIFSGPFPDTGTTTVSPDFARYRGYRVTGKVSGAPLSALLRPDEIATAAVIKVDVEGAESEVVEGMKDILPAFPNDVKIVLELTFESDPRCARLVTFFRDLGFKPYLIKNEYVDEFYLSSRPFALRELTRDIRKQVDLIFIREDSHI